MAAMMPSDSPTPSLALAFLAAWFVLAFPARAQTSDVPARLKQTTECMLKVLKTVPGVSEPRLGNATSSGWTHPFLEYRAAEDSHWEQPTRFDAQKSDDGRFWFMSMLPGMGTIDTHVTDVVVLKWKAQCTVEAAVLLE
jgi:hypothetical protein